MHEQLRVDGASQRVVGRQGVEMRRRMHSRRWGNETESGTPLTCCCVLTCAAAAVAVVEAAVYRYPRSALEDNRGTRGEPRTLLPACLPVKGGLNPGPPRPIQNRGCKQQYLVIVLHLAA
ncbi:hypothetical protein NDU88_001170 [Pleurodeles waltl]|uniref:Uncharacterized protein n=1 Tax=Pleurodeles waltl TaxID=8319 RepID=A0AAV7U656_PLEWA|nr:hypothetical protein NDU88_001170 [Pleurodeles waltl]